MSQIDKLVKKFYEKPVRNDITYDELEKIAAHYGCSIKVGGKHKKIVDEKKRGNYTNSLPWEICEGGIHNSG